LLGGIKEAIVHVWKFRGHEIARVTPDRLACDGDGAVFRSLFPKDKLPSDPTGTWACETHTLGGQLVGLRKFAVLTTTGKSIEDAPHVPADAGTN
jgi:hypothetical protein